MQRTFFRIVAVLSLTLLCSCLYAQISSDQPAFSFSAPQKVTTGATTQAGTTVTGPAVDVNNDGNTDIFVVTSAPPSSFYEGAVLIGNGNGGFALTKSTNGGGNWIYIDTNRDGYPDMVTYGGGDYNYYDPENGCQSDYSPGFVTILLGDGHGNFTGQSASTSLAIQPSTNISAVVGDFNGDGLKDIALLLTYNSGGECPYTSPPYLYILLNNGNGTFTMQTPPINLYNVPESGNTLVTGDFNGDGKLDLAFLGSSTNNSGSIQVLYGNGDGTFKVGPTYTSDTAIDAIVSADLNGDGKTDLVILTEPKSPSTKYRIATLLAKQAGGFYWAFEQTSANPVTLIGLMDLNNDGKPDLAYYSYDLSTSVTSLRAYPGLGDGNFGASQLLRNQAPSENDVIAPLKTGGPLNIFYALSYPPNKDVFLYEMLNQSK